jgi:CubicO group peptidase (beta-lactamase class C family)
LSTVTRILLLGLLGACSGDSLVRPESLFDQAFDAALARYSLPGLAVGVIDDGEVVYMRTAGELAAGHGKPVTAKTLFKIASNSKAMTASTLARLVDARTLSWNDPVIKHLPQFGMFDPWVTANITVQDLLVHNSGLPEGAGDLMLWPEPNSFTRADILAGLAYLEPEYGFRSGYAYDNLLYVVAGEVAAAAGGAAYEELVRREVFEPLGLDCLVGEWRRSDSGNLAQPHIRVDGTNVVVRPDDDIVPAITSAAAGGIRCSLEAMLQWAGNWLDPAAEQLAWLSQERRREMWAPRTFMPVSKRLGEWNNTHVHAYALGFRLADVNGTWTVSHTGTLMGMYSVMTLLPDRRSGFVIMINGPGSKARTVLDQVLLSYFTKPSQGRTFDWYAAQLDEPAPLAQTAPDTSSRVSVSPDELRESTGIWRDPWFGEVSICPRGNSVHFSAAKSPRLAGKIMRAGERYLVDWYDDSVDAEAWLDFGNDGRAGSRLRMSKVDPQADFSFDFEDLAFTRNRDCDQNLLRPAGAVEAAYQRNTRQQADRSKGREEKEEVLMPFKSR